MRCSHTAPRKRACLTASAGKQAHVAIHGQENESSSTTPADACSFDKMGVHVKRVGKRLSMPGGRLARKRGSLRTSGGQNEEESKKRFGKVPILTTRGALHTRIAFITRQQGNRIWIASQSSGTCQTVPVSLAVRYPIPTHSHSGRL